MSKKVKRREKIEQANSVGEIIAASPLLKKVHELILNGEVIENFFVIFPGLLGKATPAKFEKKILYINVDYSVLKGELKFHDTEIVKKINEYFKEERVKKVRFC